MRISDWSSDVCSSDLPNRDLAAENNPATALNDDGRCVVGLFRLTGGARLVIGTLGKRSALPFPLVVAGIQFGPLPTLICCTGGSCHRRARFLGQRCIVIRFSGAGLSALFIGTA